MASTHSDLHVVPLSDALNGKTIDVIISGSIGAVESVRFLRALRRLGAKVQPWLTAGGAQFTTETALSWAAAAPCQTKFEGTASHISLNDACVVAPASASLLGKLVSGVTDTPATALIASYLGMKKPVFILPNMHDSLHESPFVQENIQKLRSVCTFIGARAEEGKQKFPEPATLASDIAHRLNANNKSILLTMGTTRGYIDDVRYISNYSSGALGSRISEELYRQGFSTYVVKGPSPIAPQLSTRIYHVETNDEMSDAVREVLKQDPAGAVFAASVLDFVPTEKRTGKIRSSEDLVVRFKQTEKIIGIAQQHLAFKVGFKLEATTPSTELAQLYLNKYRLSHLVMNQLQDVSPTEHKAQIWRPNLAPEKEITGKEGIAGFLAQDAKKILLSPAERN